MSDRLDPSIQDLAYAFKDGELSSDVLMRAIMGHGSWMFRAGLEGGSAFALLRAPSGGQILEVFSDRHALERFGGAYSDNDASGASFTWDSLPGYKLFARLPVGEVDRVNVDQGSPYTFHFTRDQLAPLMRWAHIVATEFALADPRSVGDATRVLAKHPAYYLVLEASDDAHAIVLAPDTEGRALAAIFTAPDRAEEFVAAVGEHASGELTAVQYTPKDLLAVLRTMQLDGLVFNPMTRATPRALHVSVIDVLTQHLGTSG